MAKTRLSKADKLVLSAAGKKRKWIRYCPQCKSTDTALWGNMETAWYCCRKCNYRAPSFPEKAGK